MEFARKNPLTWLAIALVLAIVIMAVFGVLSMNNYGGYYGMMGTGAWGWGVLMMAVPGVLLIIILLAALGGLGERPMPVPYAAYPAPSPTALGVLEARYARGEISREDYLRMREDLTRGPSP